MPKVAPIYTNFNTGELSELVAARSDLEQYQKGSQSCKNLIPLMYGPLLFRPGTFYMANTKVDSEISRLLEFVFSASDAQIIEMGISYFRFFTSEGAVGAPLEVSHTYTAAELFAVHYVQSNDVITLVHGDHQPAKLTRVSASSWTLEDYDFVGTPYLPDNTDDTHFLQAGDSLPDVTTTLTATGSGNTPFLAGHVGSFWKVGGTAGGDNEQGYVKVTGFTSTTVVTVLIISQLSTSAATIEWAEGAWSDVRGWPQRCWYFQQRLCFAKTAFQPNGFWASRPFLYDDFNPGTGLDDEAISRLLPAASEIKWIIGVRTLILGTDVGDFIASTSDTSRAITPSNIEFSQHTNWGSEDIQPNIIGSYVYNVQLKNRKLREVLYSFQDDSFQSNDTTILAEHITESGIVDMAFQRNPYGVHHCVLGNGTMAIMVREVVQQVLGWAPFDIDGSFESVAVIPHPTEDHDIVFFIVNMTINGSTERHVGYFESPVIPDRQDLCFYVDDGLRYNAFDQTTGITLTLSAQTGTGITATAGSGIFTAAMIGRRIRAIDTITGDILGELKITAFTSDTVVTGDSTFNFDSLTYAENVWGVSVVTLIGLDHLEGKTVKLLIDGGVEDDEVVASGSITVEDVQDGFVFAIGLAYVGRWKNMPIEAGSATGTAQGKMKRIYQVGYKFYRSIGMQHGGDEDHLNDIVLKKPDTLMGIAEPYFTGVVPPRALNSTYDFEGHIVVEQNNPQPMCLQAVMPLLDTYDK